MKKVREIHETNCPLAFWLLLPAKKKLEDQTRRPIPDYRIPDAKCIGVEGGIVENVL